MRRNRPARLSSAARAKQSSGQRRASWACARSAFSTITTAISTASIRSKPPEKIAGHIRRVQPHVVVTFDPFGAYGHPDHIAICQLAAGGIARAAESGHRVSKFYYFVSSETRWRVYQAALKTLTSTVDGTVRESVAVARLVDHDRVDAGDHWQRVWRAVQCHKTQMSIYKNVREPDGGQPPAALGTTGVLSRVQSVNGGRTQETDLFEGLR